MRPSWLRCVLTLSCTMFTVCACVDGEPDADPSESVIFEDAGPYPTIAEADFTAAFGRAHTALLHKCCEYVARDTDPWDGPPAPSAESGASYDEAAGSACIADYHALDCPHGKEPPRWPASCEAAYQRGSLQVDERCAIDWECAEGLACEARPASADGEVIRACARTGTPLPGAREACLPQPVGGLRCAEPLRCGDDGRCGLPGLGEPCLVGPVYGDTCAKGWVCDREGEQRCVQPKPPGSVCESNDECELYVCIDGVCAQPVWGLNACVPHEESP